MKLQQKLVLNKYFLSIFNKDSFEELANVLKETSEGIDENGNSYFFYTLAGLNPKIDKDTLKKYDENIIRYTNELNRNIKWKYFQYLSLLFVEIYLDKYFNDKDGLLEELNKFLDEFNKTLPTKEQIEKFKKEELNKLAIYSATGSGKTLLLHMNIKQIKNYSNNFNKTLLITPNEGLSKQHLEELEISGFDAEIFEKNNVSLFKKDIEIIEITKLKEESGDKTVAVESFGDNNLVFIDEAHRGSSGDEWKKNRENLCKKGFSFEYSATFGQAVNSSSKKDRKKLINEYSKSIIFDYSYKYFYEDGFGKEFAILNLKNNDYQEIYLSGALLKFYQQMKIYQENPKLMKEYNLEKPLMLFIGATVNKKNSKLTKDEKEVISDVVKILTFLKNFIENKEKFSKIVFDILNNKTELIDNSGNPVFKFDYIQNIDFDDLLKILFNGSEGILHLEDINGEIALKIGENDYFGVINVGNTQDLLKTLQEKGFSVLKKQFNDSLFHTINDKDSKINFLIGAKKFTEGWNSWRVSSMGLMNVGKSEGSTIIQLFGRGVRLKGYKNLLKRSTFTEKPLEKKYRDIETLNIFGVKSNYMEEFKKFLENEDIKEKEEIILPVVYDKTYKNKNLKVLKLKKDKNFKQEVLLELNYPIDEKGFKQITLNKYSQIEIIQSNEKNYTQDNLNNEKIPTDILKFLDVDELFIELQKYKQEKKLDNLKITKNVIEHLIEHNDWYILYIPKIEIKTMNDIFKFKKIFITLLKKYMLEFYKYHKQKWESQFLEYQNIEDENMIDSYTITIDKTDDTKDLIEKLKEVSKEIEKLNEIIIDENITLFNCKKHLYNPLIFKKISDAIKIQPVELNVGEKLFVDYLKEYVKDKSIEIYLLRNQSKKGLSFFVDNNFYPDFIMWIIKDCVQYITFIDPKGLRNENLRDSGKINLFKTIKKIETKLNNSNIVLNSFILSTTDSKELEKLTSLKKQNLINKNVLFLEDKEKCIEDMFIKIFKK